MECQHRRHPGDLSRGVAPDPMRKRPMDMDDVKSMLTAKTNRADQPDDNVKQRDKQVKRVADTMRSPFSMCEVFPSFEKITKAVDRHAVHRVTLQAFIGRRKNRYLVPLSDQMFGALYQEGTVRIGF